MDSVKFEGQLQFSIVNEDGNFNYVFNKISYIAVNREVFPNIFIDYAQTPGAFADT